MHVDDDVLAAVRDALGVAAGAIREALEETGLHVELRRYRVALHDAALVAMSATGGS